MRKGKKILIVCIVLVILVSFGVYAFVYLGNDTKGGGMFADNKDRVEKTIVNNRYKYVYVSFSIDNTACKKELSYSLKNPSGEVVLSGKVNGGDIKVLKTKKYKSGKGDWKLEIKKEQEKEYYKVQRDYRLSNK